MGISATLVVVDQVYIASPERSCRRVDGAETRAESAIRLRGASYLGV
jgi:hypothetical protein